MLGEALCNRATVTVFVSFQSLSFSLLGFVSVHVSLLVHIHSFFRVCLFSPPSYLVVVPLVYYFVLVVFVFSPSPAPSRLGLVDRLGAAPHSFNSSLCAVLPKVTSKQADSREQAADVYCILSPLYVYTHPLFPLPLLLSFNSSLCAVLPKRNTLRRCIQSHSLRRFSLKE